MSPRYKWRGKADRPSFERNNHSRDTEGRLRRGTDLGRQGKGGERVVETLRGVVCESDDRTDVIFPAINQKMKMRHERREPLTRGSERTQVPLMLRE